MDSYELVKVVYEAFEFWIDGALDPDVDQGEEPWLKGCSLTPPKGDRKFTFIDGDRKHYTISVKQE